MNSHWQLYCKCILRPQNGRRSQMATGRVPRRVALMTKSLSWCFSIPLRISGCLPQGPTTKLYELSPLPILCVGPCIGPYAWQDTTLFLVPARQSNSHHTLQAAIPQWQRVQILNCRRQQRMVVGGETCTKSTSGCGSLDERGLAWGVCLYLRPMRGATR